VIAFGPVPSRRLGHSLGINNVIPKHCSYSCIYCQVGQTRYCQVQRQVFYQSHRVFKQVYHKLRQAKALQTPIDYLSFVPNGEPTLDKMLGEEIALLKQLNTKIAVITNASLLHYEEVRHDLAQADLVSLKIDALSPSRWRAINRPHPALRFEDVIAGIHTFAKEFEGTLFTETMLIKGINDTHDEISKIAEFLTSIQPSKAYIGVPTRPPAESWVTLPYEQQLNMAYHILKETIGRERVELLIGYEGNMFLTTGSVEQDLLSITSVHPMRKEAVIAFLAQARTSWKVVETLLAEGKLSELVYQGHTFYLRTLPKNL
jgi:wyosine [tRNA(Phe)-imidazoG37] synthetase (radical SAM superfamily)